MLIDNGSNDETLAEADFPLWCKYNRAFQIYRTLKSKPRKLDHSPKVIICIGPTGTGKSKWALDEYPKGFWKTKGNWWGRYEGEMAVIVDEFYGWIPFDTLLRLTDRYPLLLETKGNHVELQADTWIFTTNKDPKAWYQNAYWPAFQRRITEYKIFHAIGNISTYHTYEAAQSAITVGTTWIDN